MRIEDFGPGQRPYVVRAENGYRAFVPPSLPPDLALQPGLVRRLSGADRAVGELAGLGRGLPNPELFCRALVRREAVLSSRIEGTQASLSDLALYEAEQPRRSEGDVREVFNYVRATDHVLDPDRRLPLSLPLLREAHQILLSGVRGEYATPGDFRRTQNWIGPPGSVIDNATYVPPPPEQMWDCLVALEKYLHADGVLPPLLAIAAVHYQFEAIRPFVDGNGRIGRLLAVLLLVEWGLLPGPLLDLSAYIEPRRDRYYDGLLRVSTDGDWQGWFEFFLEVIEEQARDSLARAIRLDELRTDLRRRVATARSSGLLPLLVDELFRSPVIGINTTKDVLGVTHRAATLNLEKLVAAGILVEVTRSRTRLFAAPEIMAVMSDTPARDIR
ncbi:Fic family protein [Nocardia puris]|uniref:Fic family protein n=1 Tax=Nocardia puris TaxID=208602 RepID=A0A366D4K6_9NOCA|nr:Fic/DOC family N-terminal domain-containing protein [Nocardia puris]MBF6213891.1 Fic family protein [Nocardia puris]MBF6368530.1 Fic family protein [Nocardia puris]MBF6463017.1 Fic family protein [Nocardia puris]RBO84238.1 Fic family protein [Nocardia puris]